MGNKIMENTKHKILFIEDNKVDQMAFMRMLKDKGLPYDCTVAGSVSEAQSILGSQKFDIVIADYMLGDGTVFDILASVADAPVVLVTGAGDEEIAVKAWKAGAYDYLIKDVERNYLKALPITVENAIKHRKTEEKLQLLSAGIMSTEDSIYITDSNDRIIFVNKAFCETYGYKQEDVIGKEDSILWAEKPSDNSITAVSQDIESGWAVGFYHKRKDGSKFPVSLSRSPIKDKDGREVAIVGVARDISDRMRVEDELRTANLQLTEQNQLKSELAVMVSDALTTLLAVLKDIISDAKITAAAQTSPHLCQNLQFADENIDKVTRILTDFLDVSKIDTGEAKLEQARRRLQPAVSEVIQALSPLSAEKKD